MVRREVRFGYNIKHINKKRISQVIFSSLTQFKIPYFMCSALFFKPDYFSIFVFPPMYGTRTSGIVTVPSSFWKFSKIAATVLPIATPLPFKV